MQDLVLYSKTEQLYFTIYPRLKNFPRAEKYGLCLQIKDHFTELLKRISMAASVKSKRKTYLQEADGYLQGIKMLIKLSAHNKYISQGMHERISVSLTEINRLLVGFIKSS